MLDLSTIVRRYLKMQALLTAGPMTVGQLAKSAGCTYEAARRWKDALLDAEAIEFQGFAPKTQRGSHPSLYRWKQ